MLEATESNRAEDERILLDLLNSVERDGGQSQRRLASELGIALGLVNAYLRRCVKKGLVKVTAAPARRYIYYLTPQGFAEKSRLTVEYLSVSFSFFRRAKAECGVVFKHCGRAWLSPGGTRRHFRPRGDRDDLRPRYRRSKLRRWSTASRRSSPLSVCRSRHPSTAIVDNCDAVLITDLQRTAELTEQASALFGAERVLTPKLDSAAAAGAERRQIMTECLMTQNTS